MKRKFSIAGCLLFTVLLCGCVKQVDYDAVVAERNEYIAEVESLEQDGNEWLSIGFSGWGV